jgi:AraC-like DNA-binding protein|tara:strand:- start:18 stop:857 length:840 start_codon:yes stop_codon:yes gene_type:complete
MNIITLPDELNLNSPHAIEIYDYVSTQEISKQQIILSKNTFSFLQNGTKEVFFDNSSKLINTSQFLLMKAGNSLMTEKFYSNERKYRSILFFFSNEAVFNFIRKYKLNPQENASYASMYSFDYDLFITGFTNSIFNISKLSKSLQKNILDAKFDEIMLYLTEVEGVDFLYSLINDRDNSSQKFIQTVENNILNKLSIKELSFLANMSTSSFKRAFQKQFKSSPSKWFQEKRLEHAAFLLRSKSKRSSDIYQEIGYENLSNFIQAFKLKFGVTPKKYQEN